MVKLAAKQRNNNMKLALVDNKKVEAAKGLKGTCQLCQEPVIPKCGKIRVYHWAHKSCTHCDRWWENETEWHRNWKNHFPEEWQEVVAFDEKTSEKHIADIKTNYGMVIEFQHSYISEEERISRELFYKNMIWVVDGTRRKRDYERFCDILGNLWYLPNTSLYVVKYGIDNIPKEWQNCKVPVFFDFQGLLGHCNYDQRKNHLWCLLPIREQNRGLFVIIAFNRETFAKDIINGKYTFNYREIANMIDNNIRKFQNVSIRRL